MGVDAVSINGIMQKLGEDYVVDAKGEVIFKEEPKPEDHVSIARSTMMTGKDVKLFIGGKPVEYSRDVEFTLKYKNEEPKPEPTPEPPSDFIPELKKL